MWRADHPGNLEMSSCTRAKAVKEAPIVVKYENPYKAKPRTREPPKNIEHDADASTRQYDIASLSVSQLWGRMKASVSELQKSKLSGRQLHRFNCQSLTHLGAKPARPQHIPAKILMGMRKKTVRRAKREREQPIEAHVAGTEHFCKKHVLNKSIIGKRPAELRRERAKEERLRKHRK